MSFLPAVIALLNGKSLGGVAYSDGASNAVVVQSAVISDPASNIIAAVKASGVAAAFASDAAIVVSVRDSAPCIAVATPSLSAGLVIKASPGALFSLSCCPTLSGYLMLFDATAAPSDGAVAPAWAMPIQAAVGGSWFWPTPLQFLTGIVAVYSSTGPFTKTASVAAHLSSQAH